MEDLRVVWERRVRVRVRLCGVLNSHDANSKTERERKRKRQRLYEEETEKLGMRGCFNLWEI